MRRRLLARLVLLICIALPTGAGPACAQDETRAQGEIWRELPSPRPLPPPTSGGYAWINGIQLYYAVYGTGEPLLLLHGALGNSDYWGNQVPAFARKYRVIVVDSRGHGRSTRDGRLYSYRLLAADILALLDLLQIDKVSIVGWSDGANLALHLAIHHPERLNKVVVFEANYRPSGIRGDIDSNDTFLRYVELANHDYERLSATPHDYPLFLRIVSIFWGSEPDFTATELGRITVPTMIAAGEHDEAIKRDHTLQLAKLVPGAQLEILPEASFFAMWQQPKAFNRMVLQFLQKK